MNLIHIGLVCSNEPNASRFYGELLGGELTRRSKLPRNVSEIAFGLDDECEILYFGVDDVVFELFLTGWAEATPRKISHTCIEVENRGALLERATEMGFEVREAPRGDYSIFFLVDGDGNLFEVKDEA